MIGWLVWGNIVFAQMPPATVEVTSVTTQNIKSGQTFVGTAVPVHTSVVGSEVEGKVRELLVDDGSQVRKGDAIAKLDSELLKIQRDAAVAQLRVREAELSELKNGTRPEEIRAAEARAAAAKADLDYARGQFERNQQLYRKSFSAAEELEEARRARDRAEQQLRQELANLALLQSGTRAERIAQAEAQVEAQRQAIRQLETQIEKHSVLAPFNGTVTAKQTEVGNWIGKGDPVVELASIDSIDIIAAVTEDFIANIQPGDPVRVEVNALKGESFVGRVAGIIPKADERSRTFPVKVRVDNPDEPGGAKILPGMFASATLAVGQERRAPLVPKDAVVLGGQMGPVVYRISSEGASDAERTVQPIPVELGAATGGNIEVRGPLNEGDLVVTMGNERLRPGQKVVVKGAATPRPEQKSRTAPGGNGE